MFREYQITVKNEMQQFILAYALTNLVNTNTIALLSPVTTPAVKESAQDALDAANDLIDQLMIF